MSALRHLQPVKSDALEYVTEHVKKSQAAGKPNCSVHKAKLSFVYGRESGLNDFKNVRFTVYWVNV